MWNSAQPTHEDTDDLAYATMPPRIRSRIARLWTPQSMVTQFRLYKGAQTENIVSHMAVSDVYDWIFQDIKKDVSKTLMGSIVCLATLYNPRLLKGKTKQNSKPRVVYAWKDMRELTIGLEWMICTWLPRFCKKYGYPDTSITDMTNALAQLPSLGKEFEEDIWELDIEMSEPNWVEITAGLEERIPTAPKEEEIRILKKRPDPIT